MSKGLEAFEKIYDSLNDLPYSINDEYLDIVYKLLYFIIISYYECLP